MHSTKNLNGISIINSPLVFLIETLKLSVGRVDVGFVMESILNLKTFPAAKIVLAENSNVISIV